MKKLSTLILVCLLISGIKAQTIEINNPSAGNLRTTLLGIAGCNTFTDVKLTGSYNSQDFADINAMLTSAQRIDMLEAVAVNATIPQATFRNNTTLKEFICPTMLTNIESEAFSGCSSLAKATFNRELVQIDKEAFRKTALKKIVFTESITAIKDYAFANIDSVDTIIVTSSKPPTIDPTTFDGIKVKEVFVPSVAYINYLSSAWNNQFKTLAWDIIFNEKPNDLANNLMANYPGFSKFSRVMIVGLIGDQDYFDMNKMLNSATTIDLSQAVSVVDIIPQGVFNGNNNLQSFHFPQRIKKIEDKAFADCIQLQNVTLNADLEAIGPYAFIQCNIQHLTLTQNIVAIDDESFSHNRILEEITCLGVKPADIKSSTFTNNNIKNVYVPAQAFKDYSSDPEWGKFNIVAADGYLLVNIPTAGDLKSILDSKGYNVKEIFKLRLTGDCNNDDFLTIRNYIPNIEMLDISGLNIHSGALPANALSGCDKLSRLTLPTTLTTISEAALSGCSALETLVIPASVTSIEKGAFARSGLTGVFTIQENLNNIGEGAFSQTKLTEFSVNAANKFFTAVNGILFDITGKVLLSCPTLKVSTSLSFPAGINSIGSRAFEYCEKITGSLNLPVNLTSIGTRAFAYTQFSGTIYWPSNTNTVMDETFLGCPNINKIVFTGSINSLGNKAFANCANLSNFNWPTGIKTIGTGLFANSGITGAVAWTDDVSVVPDATFYNCTGITTIDISKATAIGVSAFYKTGITSLNLPFVSSIGSSAFQDCINLNTTIFSSNLVSIEANAFKGCSMLSIGNLPGSLTTLGENAFSGTATTGTVYWPSKINRVNSAFSLCKNISQVVLPLNVTEIGTNAFYGCSKLAKVNFPDKLVTIGVQSFSGTLLNTVELPASVTTIGAYSFANTALSDLSFGPNLTSIDSYAFSGAPLTSIRTTQSTPPAVNMYTFLGIDKKNCTITGPVGFASTYKNASTEWNDFKFSVGTATDAINNNPVTVSASSQGVVLKGVRNQRITIYNVLGVIQKELIASDDTLELTLSSKGIYIIVTENGFKTKIIR